MVLRFLISVTLGVAVTTYIVRELTVEEFGIYSVLLAIIGYVGILSGLGIPAAIQRFVPEALQNAQFALLKKLVWRGLLLRMALSAIAVALLFIFHDAVGTLFKLDNFFSYLTLIALGIVFFLETQILTFVLSSVFLHKYLVIASTAYTIVRALIVFLVFYLDWGLPGLLISETIAWCIWCAFQYAAYHLKFARLHADDDNPPLPLRRYARYSLLSSLNDLGGSILGVSTDFLVISAYLGPAAVGLYAFADKVVKMIVKALPHIVLIDVIRPAFFSKYTKTGDTRLLGEMFNLLLKIGAFSVYPVAVGLIMVGDKLILYVFREDYLEALQMLWALAAFTAINIFFQPIGLVIKSIEKVEYALYSKIFAVYNLVAAILVVQPFGVMGVLLVSCSAASFKNLFLYHLMKKHVKFDLDWAGLGRIALNAGGMGLCVFFLRPYIDGLLSLLLVCAGGGLIYIALSYLNKAFSQRERDWFNSVLPKPLFVF